MYMWWKAGVFSIMPPDVTCDMCMWWKAASWHLSSLRTNREESIQALSLPGSRLYDGRRHVTRPSGVIDGHHSRG